MLHHIELYVSDLNASHAFWTTILSKIGWKLTGRWNDGFTLSNEADPYITFVQVADKYRTNTYHRCAVGLNHLAFKVKTRDEVDILRQYCIENGISLLYDERYPFATGNKDYYALFIEDPDRIKVEFVVSD